LFKTHVLIVGCDPAKTEVVVAQDTRTRILNAAGPVFAERGYQKATVREICRAASVNLASMNYHFGHKERLYIETVQQAQRNKIEQVPSPQWQPETSPAEKLRGFVRTLITRMIGAGEAPWQTRLMMREIMQPTHACQELVQNYFRPQFEILLELLEELVPAETTQSKRHQLAFSVVGQCLYYRVAHEVVALLIDNKEREAHYDAHQLSDHITDLMLAAMSAPGSWLTSPQDANTGLKRSADRPGEDMSLQ
jgi:AcrR family transcriptional regulator